MSDYQLSQELGGSTSEPNMPEVQPDQIQEVQEIQAPEYETEQPDQENEVSEEIVAPVPQEAVQAKNFRQLKDQKERVERERDELQRQLQSYTNKNTSELEEDLEFNIGEHEIADGKHLRKVDGKLKRLEAQLKQYQQEASVNSIAQELRNRYSDLDEVVSNENLAILQEEYPEIAETINSTTNLRAKAISAYTLIKKLGINNPAPTYNAEKETAQKNAAKPKLIASMSPQKGNSPLSNANRFADGLTPALKKQLIQEMMDAKK